MKICQVGVAEKKKEIIIKQIVEEDKRAAAEKF